MRHDAPIRVNIWTMPSTEHAKAREGWHLICYTCRWFNQPVHKWWDPTLTLSDERGDEHFAWHKMWDPGSSPAPASGDVGGGETPAQTPLADGQGPPS